MNIIKLNKKSHNKKKFFIPASWHELKNGLLYKDLLNNYFLQKYHPMFQDITVKFGGLSSEILKLEETDSVQISVLEHYPEKISPLIEGNYSIVANIYHLPFNPYILPVDHIVLANTLNFSANPLKLLREADRIISDHGYLYISLFTSLSCLFQQKLFNFGDNKLMIHQFSLFRLLDALNLLNYKIIDQQILNKHNSYSSLNRFFGDLIVIVAQKQTSIPIIKNIKKEIITQEVFDLI